MIYYYQINLSQEPQHPVWKMILLKQCCGLNFKYFKTKTEDYQWFEQTPFFHFCPDLHLKKDQIIKFEDTFKMKYSPQGPCLPLVNNELKIELILISIGLGFGVLLMLLTWLFIWQDRLSYLSLLRDMLQKQKRNSIINTNKSLITSVPQHRVRSDMPEISTLDTTKPSETKRLYKGYLTALEDVK